MPIYEYDCPTCGRFEYLQKFSDSPLSKCPTCKGRGDDSAVSRVMSASAFHLKGSGWYKTDYASSPKKQEGAAGAAREGAAPSGGSSAESSAGGETSTGEKSAKPSGSCGGGCACH